jgi:hypothetical protein
VAEFGELFGITRESVYEYVSPKPDGSKPSRAKK